MGLRFDLLCKVRSSTALAQQILDIEAFVGESQAQLPDVDVAMYAHRYVCSMV